MWIKYSLVIIISYLVCLICTKKLRRFERNTLILHFLAQNHLLSGWWVMKFTISCIVPLYMLHTKLRKDWPSYSREDVNGRHRKTEIGHLSVSDDLKMPTCHISPEGGIFFARTKITKSIIKIFITKGEIPLCHIVYLFEQVRPNDVWTCVACSYFIYKKMT